MLVAAMNPWRSGNYQNHKVSLNTELEFALGGPLRTELGTLLWGDQPRLFFNACKRPEFPSELHPPNPLKPLPLNSEEPLHR
jgi:hypothetical protein